MRQRKVQEKAVTNLIAFMQEIDNNVKDFKQFSSSELAIKHGVSKSAWSIIKKLGGMEPTREYALKILEILRLRFDKSTDALINNEWRGELDILKDILKKLVDNTSHKNNRSEGFISHQISERVYLAGQIMHKGMEKYNNYIELDKNSIELLCDKAVEITDILLNKLNKK